jgi:hypothetical protein
VQGAFVPCENDERIPGVDENIVGGLDFALAIVDVQHNIAIILALDIADSAPT